MIKGGDRFFPCPPSLFSASNNEHLLVVDTIKEEDANNAEYKYDAALRHNKSLSIIIGFATSSCAILVS